MKTKTFLGLLIIAFIIIIFTSLSTCHSGVVPYVYDSSKLPKYTYEEGFRGILDYTSYPENENIESSMNSQNATNSEYNKIKGFDGLLTSPNKSNEKIDVFAETKGETSCKSYGLMNSKGFLCLSPQQIQLLTTRGGNFV